MPRDSIEQRRRRLRRRKQTHSKREFEEMRRWFPNRLHIVAEGDSWFAYPPHWIIGKPPNLISHLSGWTKGKANFYSMASNGDEAVDMVSGPEKHKLVDILRWHTKARNRKPIDLLLFSGGGNDVVGENDFDRFIAAAGPGGDARDYLRIGRLKRKVKQIGLAYQELADIRDHYSPTTVIVTHTYDYPFASNQGANFLGGLIKTRAWMKRFMDAINVPVELQTQVIKVVMDTMAEEVLKIQNSRQKFIVSDTRGTLLDRKEWLNEIHPTKEGFEAVARVIYDDIRTQFPELSPP
jgi:hypothetical protein